MIKFLHLHGENIGTFQEIDIDLDRPGLTLLSGKTGAGKSTIWDLLCELLFQETPRDGKAAARTALVHPLRNGFLGWVDLDVDGTRYRMLEARKHREHGTGRKVYRDGKDWTPYATGDTEKRGRSIVMDFAEFTTAVYLPQSSVHMLLSGAPSKRWDYAAEIAGTASYDDIAAALPVDAAEIKAADATLASLREQIAATNADLPLVDVPVYKALLAWITRLLASAKTEAARLRNVVHQHAAADAADGMRDWIKTALSNMRSEPEPFFSRVELERIIEGAVGVIEQHARCDDAQRRIAELSAAERTLDGLSALERDVAWLHAATVRATERARVAQERLSEINKLHDTAICPTCRRPWPEADQEEEIRALKAIVRDQQARSRASLRELRKVSDNLARARKIQALKVDAENKPAIAVEIAALVSESCKQLLREVDRYEANAASRETLEAKLARLPKVEHPSLTPSVAEERLTAVEAKIERLEAEIRDLESKHAVRARADAQVVALTAKYEKSARERHKLALLEVTRQSVLDMKRNRTVAVVDTLVNAASAYYDGGTFSYELSTRKFELYVSRRASSGKFRSYRIPTRRLSGGERDQASVAFLFALQALHKREHATNLLVLDEPCAHVDNETWVDFLQRLQATMPPGKSIFVSSHTAAAQSTDIWDHRLTVNKDGDVSRIVRER